MRKASRKTALIRALRDESPLCQSVCQGMGAIEASHHVCFEEGVRSTFQDSLDLDEALRAGNDQANRWDYLLSHSPSNEVVAVEPHSAKQDEISTVIKKRTAAREQLRPHLREGAQISRWLWVASSGVYFADTEKVKKLLDQNGILFVGKKVLEKHLGAKGKPDPDGRLKRKRSK